MSRVWNVSAVNNATTVTLNCAAMNNRKWKSGVDHCGNIFHCCKSLDLSCSVAFNVQLSISKTRATVLVKQQV